jgi:hypothetical protein
LDIPAVALVMLLSTIPPAAVPPASVEQVRPLLTAVSHPPALTGSAGQQKQNRSSSRDSLRNGTPIGLAAGGVLGFAAGVTACGAGSILSMSNEQVDCTGPALMGTAIFGAVGARIGAGVDALLEKTPSPTGVSQGYRRGVRLHICW